jgi:protein Mpv17
MVPAAATHNLCATCIYCALTAVYIASLFFIAAAVYFGVIRCLEGHPELVMTTLQSKFLPTLAANYMIWPLAHIINFRFVPSEYRILYNNVVCVAWLTGLSFLTHSKINFMQLLHVPHF